MTAIPLAAITSVWTALPLLLIAGVACAPLVAATVDALGTLVPQRFRGEAIAWHASALTAGTSLGPPLAGWVIDHKSWQWGFVLIGLLGLVISLVVASAVRLRPSVRRTEMRPPRT